MRSRPEGDADAAQRMLRMTSRVALSALVAAITWASPAGAQLSLGTSYGVYLPFGHPLIREVGGLNGGPVPYPVFEKWQIGALAMMARVGYQLRPRLGVDGKLSLSPGRVDTRDSLNEVVEQSAVVSIASARIPILLTRPVSTTIVQVAPGIAVIHRAGKAWSGVLGTTDPAAVLAIGAGGTLDRSSKISSRIEVEAYLSYAQFNYGPYNPTTGSLHYDLMVSIGFDYSFRRPRRRR